MLKKQPDARLQGRPAQSDECATMPLIPASWGEVLDKISILEIKKSRMTNERALANVRRELDELSKIAATQLSRTDVIADLSDRLKRVNESLWDIEDAIREKDRVKDFGEKFIALARSVYQLNDQRAELKKMINVETSSRLVEEKSYHRY